MWVMCPAGCSRVSEPLVKLDRHDLCVVLSLNRPERHNALVPELLLSLIEALRDDRCQQAMAVLLRAEGRSFSTGGDLLGFQHHQSTLGEYAYELVGLLNQFIIALYTHPAPVVCAVQGQVTGGSLGFLLASDHVVMHRSANITPWYTEVGFSPDGGWTAMLPDIIGRQQSLHWLATNACYDADYCHALGVVQEVVDDDCDTAAFDWLAVNGQIKLGSTRNSKKLINNNINDIKDKLEYEREVFVEQIQSPEARRGIEQFLRRNTR